LEEKVMGKDQRVKRKWRPFLKPTGLDGYTEMKLFEFKKGGHGKHWWYIRRKK